ncbi:MAG: carbohydrate ABC transporter permease [Roseburia sp.]|nr:carbohydrate ABC transporter permease [Roseburia sp.]
MKDTRGGKKAEESTNHRSKSRRRINALGKHLRSAVRSIRNMSCLSLFAVPVCLPVIMVLCGSIKSGNELAAIMAPLYGSSSEDVTWNFLSLYPTGRHYLRLLFYSPEFFTVFWNSMKIVSLILVGQLVTAVPAAWAFATFRFRGRSVLFTLYILLMLLPFQVTMLPSYLVLQKLHLINTQGAVIIPAIFSTFPVFLIYRGFAGIPRELLEAAKMDGAGEWTSFWKIGVPLGSGQMMSALVLGFLDYWNMMEQPLAFLRTKALWPLSLYLPQIDAAMAGRAFAASVITLIPAVFVFIIGQDYLEQGIALSGMKA